MTPVGPSPAKPVDPAPAPATGVLPPVAVMGAHWVSGAWTNPGQVGDADHWRLDTWEDNFQGTVVDVEFLVNHGIPVLFGADTNTPKAHLPKFHPDQVWITDDSGYDKILFVPAGGYTLGKVTTERHALNSDHDLRVANITLLLHGDEVATIRFGTANIQNLPNLSRAKTLADVKTVYAQVDACVWQEIEEKADDADIDSVFPLAQWTHLYYELEVPISLRKSLLPLTPVADLPAGVSANKAKKQTSKGRDHVSPSRYNAYAICTPSGK